MGQVILSSCSRQETKAEEGNDSPKVTQLVSGEARIWTVCLSPKSQISPPASPASPMSLDPGQGAWPRRNPLTPEGAGQKGVPSFAGVAGFWGGSGTPSDRASLASQECFRLFSQEPRELPSEAVGSDS